MTCLRKKKTNSTCAVWENKTGKRQRLGEKIGGMSRNAEAGRPQLIGKTLFDMSEGPWGGESDTVVIQHFTHPHTLQTFTSLIDNSLYITAYSCLFTQRSDRYGCPWSVKEVGCRRGLFEGARQCSSLVKDITIVTNCFWRTRSLGAARPTEILGKW